MTIVATLPVAADSHPRICVATLVFGELPYLRYTESINRAYCERHGYQFEIIRPEQSVERSPIWGKVSGVRRLLERFEYVLFLDADAFFVDFAYSLEQLITAHMGEAAFLLGTDRRDKSFAWSDTNANCGVFLARRTDWAFAILDEWWQSAYRDEGKWLWAWPPEQGSFNSYIRLGPHAQWIKTIYYAHMNGADGTFIRHLIGVSDELRLAYLRRASRNGVASTAL